MGRFVCCGVPLNLQFKHLLPQRNPQPRTPPNEDFTRGRWSGFCLVAAINRKRFHSDMNRVFAAFGNSYTHGSVYVYVTCVYTRVLLHLGVRVSLCVCVCACSVNTTCIFHITASSLLSAITKGWTCEAKCGCDRKEHFPYVGCRVSQSSSCHKPPKLVNSRAKPIPKP